jgi:hypothetical protein
MAQQSLPLSSSTRNLCRTNLKDDSRLPADTIRPVRNPLHCRSLSTGKRSLIVAIVCVAALAACAAHPPKVVDERSRAVCRELAGIPANKLESELPRIADLGANAQSPALRAASRTLRHDLLSGQDSNLAVYDRQIVIETCQKINQGQSI